MTYERKLIKWKMKIYKGEEIAENHHRQKPEETCHKEEVQNI